MIEEERQKIAHDARESLNVFYKGQFTAQSAGQIVQKLHEGDTAISPEITNKPPFDVDGIDVDLTSEEVVAFVRESRSYR